jgi:prevent-host-death family protein
MAESVGVRELRQNASKVLKRVKAGESIDVTEHGRPIARLVPIKPSPLEQMYLDDVSRY